MSRAASDLKGLSPSAVSAPLNLPSHPPHVLPRCCHGDWPASLPDAATPRFLSSMLRLHSQHSLCPRPLPSRMSLGRVHSSVVQSRNIPWTAGELPPCARNQQASVNRRVQRITFSLIRGSLLIAQSVER